MKKKVEDTKKCLRPVLSSIKYDDTTDTYTAECDGKKYRSIDGEHWEFDADPAATKMFYGAAALELKLPEDIASPASESGTQAEIREITDAMKDLLLYKNEKYGDSAINPIGIFTKHIKTAPGNTASILVRLDDKLGRVKNADVLRVNDVSDIIGYCTLLLISMGVTKEDIEKFKD